MIGQSILIVANLFLLESLLSVDNAAALGILVNGLDPPDRKRALRWGLIGAYVMRGLALLGASWLVGLWGLKIAGGFYLLYLTYDYYKKTIQGSIEEDASESAFGKKVALFVEQRLRINKIWRTIILVEIMDMSFSIDNIFAAVAITPNRYFIILGVFMGMFAMRFVAGWFSELIDKYPSLNKSAFIVIGLLGLKLILNGLVHGLHLNNVTTIMDNHTTDLLFSLAMIIVFCWPMLNKNN